MRLIAGGARTSESSRADHGPGPAAVDMEIQSKMARLIHDATHDTLTGLPTRSVLLERLNGELQRIAASGQVAVLFVDLDNFKLVNDSLGHECGDRVLCEMARRIRGCVRSTDTVSRFGGDEVVILHPDAIGGSEAAIGARILAAMCEPIKVAGREVVVTASVGVALGVRGNTPAEQLLREADTALYAAKKRGRSRMERFNEELHARVARRVQIESDLRAALRNEKLYVHYQPQVNLQTGRMVGVEALVRWNHPVHGQVSPAEFIPVAEECGLIHTLGQQVLRTACRQLACWNVEVPDAAIAMTVNVSPRQLEDPAFIACVKTLLDETGISPTSLCLELTESVLTTRDCDTIAMLDRIHALGVYVAIDDFGTEYSSLSRLRALPVEVLKIDRSFIDGLPDESGDTAIVSSILSLAVAMGKHVIAEGVERPEQAVALRAMGCTVAQGYLFSQAVAPGLIPLMLERSPWQLPAAAPCASAAIDALSTGRRGHFSFIDELLDHIGAPMGARSASNS
ncbi:MAG: EAL domain-containing protein [Pseudomonadota bacterium]